MPTTVYLMRHGEVTNDGEKRYNGHIDIDITQKGVDQMHRLAGLLEGKKHRRGLFERSHTLDRRAPRSSHAVSAFRPPRSVNSGSGAWARGRG